MILLCMFAKLLLGYLCLESVRYEMGYTSGAVKKTGNQYHFFSRKREKKVLPASVDLTRAKRKKAT